MQGRYIDADQQFEHNEPTLLGLGPSERARYALYRGANYLALGDYLSAQRWLGSVATSESAPLVQLTAAEQQLLHSSLLAVQGSVAVQRTGAAPNATGTGGTGPDLAFGGLPLSP